jgi:hypothetical protein
MAHPGAITGTCKYDDSPHLHSAYCERWEPVVPTGIPAEVEDAAISSIEEDAELRDVIRLRMDSTLAADLLATLTETALSLFQERSALLDFLVSSGYPIDWSEAPSEGDASAAPVFPPGLRRSIARRWATTSRYAAAGHGHTEDEWLKTCADSAGWEIEEGA